jgi:DNA repair exonuclease SbcCD ATPase subunit
MYIHSLKMNNFMSYKAYYKEFKEDEIVSIFGDNLSGKSVIIDAIDYATTGASRVKRETDLIHNGQATMYVELVLDDNGVKHLIRRGRNRKGQGQLRFDDIDKKREAQEAIYNLLKMDGKEFHMTCFFKSVNINMFMELEPKERKEYMMRWMRNDHWKYITDRAKENLKHNMGSKSAATNRVEALSSTIKVLPITVDQHREHLDRKKQLIKDIYKNTKAIENQIALEAQRREKINGLKRDMRLVKDKIERAREQYRDSKDELKRLDNIEQRISDLDDELRKRKYKSLKTKIRGYLTEEARYKANIEGLKNDLKKAKTSMTGVCPITGHGCKSALFTKKLGDTYEKDISANKKKLATVQDKIRKYDTCKGISDTRKSLDGQANDIKSLNIPSIKANLTKYRARRKEIERKIIDLERAVPSARLQNTKDNKDRFEKELAGIQRELDDYRSAKKHNKEVKYRIDIENKNIAKLNDKIEVDTILINATSPTGIPSMEIENNFNEIEDEANIILEELDDSLELIFTPDRELSYWEKQCPECGYTFPKGYSKSNCKCGAIRRKARKDELNISVLEHGIERPFNSLSSGGKTMVSLALRVSLMRFLGRQYGCNIQTLFFDEVDGPLDDNHIERVGNLVTNLLIEKFGYTQIFWVSHSDIIKEAATSGLYITKKDDCSKVTEWQK